MTRLQDKIAIITGAASGIGESTARRFAREGASLVLCDIDDVAGPVLARELGATFVRCDVTDEGDVEAVVETAASRYGRLDVYVANAGIGGATGPITELEAKAFDRTIAVNLRGVALGMKHAIRQMHAQSSGGCFISTASVAGLVGGLGPHIYSATKAGILGLTRSVASEQASHGIRVNAISPGGTLTNFFAHAAGVEAAMAALLEHGQPIQRAGLPEDIAATAAYLASDDAGFITAQNIIVDGGISAIYGGTAVDEGQNAGIDL